MLSRFKPRVQQDLEDSCIEPFQRVRNLHSRSAHTLDICFFPLLKSSASAVEGHFNINTITPGKFPYSVNLVVGLVSSIGEFGVILVQFTSSTQSAHFVYYFAYSWFTDTTPNTNLKVINICNDGGLGLPLNESL